MNDDTQRPNVYRLTYLALQEIVNDTNPAPEEVAHREWLKRRLDEGSRFCSLDPAEARNQATYKAKLAHPDLTYILCREASSIRDARHVIAAVGGPFKNLQNQVKPAPSCFNAYSLTGGL